MIDENPQWLSNDITEDGNFPTLRYELNGRTIIHTGVEAEIIRFTKKLIGKDGTPTALFTTAPVHRITVGTWFRVRTVDGNYGMPVRIMAEPKRYKKYVVARLQPYAKDPLPFNVLIPEEWFLHSDDITEKAEFRLWNRIFGGKI